MDENVIDTLRIEIVGDDSGAVSNIEKLVANLEKIKGVTSGANRGLTAIQKHLNSIATAADNINSGSIAKLHQIANGLNALAKVGSINISSKVAERITKLGTAVDSLKGVDMSKLYELAGGLKAIKDVGDVTIPNLKTITQATSPVSAVPPMPAAPSGTTSVGVTEVTNEVEDLGGTLVETTGRFETFKKIATGCMGAVKDKVTGVVSSIRGFFKRFTMRIMYRFMNFIISSIVNSVKQGINNVYQYSKAFDGRFSKSMDTLATSFNYLTNSLGAMAAPIINLVTPYIDQLVDQFVVLLNVVNQVFARLSGADTWTKAIKVTTEYAAAADDATEANKRLKKSLLGIDEINALQDNSGSVGGAANTAANPAYAFQEMPLNTSAVDDIIKKLNRIKDVAIAIGVAIEAWKIGTTLAKLIGLTAGKTILLAAGIALIASGLALIIGGAIDIIQNGIDLFNFFETLLGDVLTIIGGILTGAVFGSALIGGAIAAIIAGVATAFVGIWSAITEGINWLNGMLTTVGITLVGAAIGAFFGPLGILIGGLVGLAIGLWTDLIIALVQGKDDMSHLFIEFGNIWWSGFNTIKGYAQKFINWWKDGIDTIARWWIDGWNTMKNNADKFWNSITSNVNALWIVIKSVTKLIVDKWKTGFDVIRNKASSCWNGIKTAWKSGAAWINDNFIKPVKDNFNSLWSSVKSKASAAWSGVKNTYTGAKSWFVSNVITPVGNYFTGLWNGFRNKARSAWEGVKTVFSKAGTFFESTFKNAWQKVVNVFSTGGRIFVDIKNGVLSAFKSIVNSLIKGINNVVSVPFEGINTALKTLKDIKIGTLQPFADIREITVPKIPLLADGGQVNAGQMFIAREAGAELVGNVGRKTSVMNNDQIVESVSQGVADANAEQNALLREEISILRRLLEKDTTVTISSGSLVSGLERKNRRDGRTIVPVGV